MSPRFSDLGPLEREVFGLLDAKRPLSVESVQEALRRKGHSLAYTTVMTVLVRLHSKNYVARQKEGRQYLYTPAAHADAQKQSLLMKVKSSLLGRSRLKPILTLLDVEGDSLSSDELKELRSIVDKKIKERRK